MAAAKEDLRSELLHVEVLLETGDVMENILKGFLKGTLKGAASIQREFSLGYPRARATVIVLKSLGYIREKEEFIYEYAKYPDNLLNAVKEGNDKEIKEILKEEIKALK